MTSPVIADNESALHALVRQTALSRNANEPHFVGRYSRQDLVSAQAIDLLVRQGLAERYDDHEGEQLVFVTEAGMQRHVILSAECPDRRLEPGGTGLERLALLGSSNWERGGHKANVFCGMLLEQQASTRMLDDLTRLAAHKTNDERVHFWTEVLVMPPFLAARLPSATIQYANGLELVEVPAETHAQLDECRKFRGLLDVQFTSDDIRLFLYTGNFLKYLASFELTEITRLLHALAANEPLIIASGGNIPENESFTEAGGA